MFFRKDQQTGWLNVRFPRSFLSININQKKNSNESKSKKTYFYCATSILILTSLFSANNSSLVLASPTSHHKIKISYQIKTKSKQRKKHHHHTMTSLDNTSNHSTSLDSLSNHSASSFTYGGCVLFPWKLHEMLDSAEEKQFTSVVSWLPDCRSFKVHDKDIFVSLIMPQFFEEQTRYKSFQRQLNMWGFERILEQGPEKGGYNHPAGYFVRGESSLCTRMTRLKKKKKMNAHTTTTATASSKATAIVQRTNPNNNNNSSSSSSSSSEGIIKGVMRRASRASLVFTKALCDQLEAFDRYISGGGGGDNNDYHNDYEQDLTTTPDHDNTPYHYDDDNYIEPEPYDQYQQGATTTGSSSVSVSAGRGLLRRASRASVVITKALHDQLEALDDFMTSSSGPDATATADANTTEFEFNYTDHPPMVRRITDCAEDTSEDSTGDENAVEEFAGQNFFMVDDDEGPGLRRLSSIGKRIFLHHSRVSSATASS